MARCLSILAPFVVVLMAVGCAAEAQPSLEKPNILFVQTDDQDAASLEYIPYVNDLIRRGHDVRERPFLISALLPLARDDADRSLRPQPRGYG
jgi:hypothetical protein